MNAENVAYSLPVPSPLRLAVVVNPVPGWNPLDLETAGGGEEALLALLNAFRRRGHDITLYWHGEGVDELPNGVKVRQ